VTVEADVRYPRHLLTLPAVRGIIDFREPVAILRSRVAGTEAGDYVSQQFCERCDTVLGTNLAQGYAVIRMMRAERLFASLGVDPDGGVPGKFWERCDELVRTRGLRVPGYAQTREQPVTARQAHLNPLGYFR